MNNNLFNTAFMKVLFEQQNYCYLKKNAIKIKRDRNISWDLLSLTNTSEEIIILFTNELNWKLLGYNTKLTNSFIINNHDKLNPKIISRYQELDRVTIDILREWLYWPYIVKYQDSICSATDMNFIATHIAYIDIDILCQYREINSNWIDTNWLALNINGDIVSRYQKLTSATINNHIGSLNFTSLLISTSVDSETMVNTYLSHININIALEFIQFSESFLELHYNELNKSRISRYQHTLTDQFLSNHADDLNWTLLSKYAYLTESQITTYFNRLDKRLISKYQVLSETVIRDNIYKLDTTYLSKYQTFTDAFMIEMAGFLDPKALCVNQNISDTILNSRLVYVLDLAVLSKYRSFTETQILKYKSRLNMTYVSQYSLMSEGFILSHYMEFKFNSYKISRYQTLSPTTMELMFDWLDIDTITKYQTLDENIINNHKDMFNIDLIKRYQITLNPAFIDNLLSYCANN